MKVVKNKGKEAPTLAYHGPEQKKLSVRQLLIRLGLMRPLSKIVKGPVERRFNHDALRPLEIE